MNKYQKIVQQHFLNNEEAVLKQLYQANKNSLEDINKVLAKLQAEFDEITDIYDTMEDEAEKERLKSIKRSKIYQIKYQKSLKKQVGDTLDKLHKNQYKTVSAYFNECYTNGYIGAIFDLQGQGIPLCMPIDQNRMTRAVQLNSKINKDLYTHLGENLGMLKTQIAAQISRGISNGMTYAQITRNLADKMTGTYNNPKGSYAYAKRIIRTEGHYLQCQSAFDSMVKSKEKGAKIVKQWDSTLDGRTRTSHASVDGEIRELDEKFSNGMLMPGDPNGKAEEIINCRCVLSQRAKWMLDEEELIALKKRAEYFGLNKTDNFEEFKQKYLKALSNKDLTNSVKSDKINRQVLKADNFPQAFKTEAEKKNTERLVEYINNLDGANTDTLALYNAMGKLESLNKHGISFKITHDKNHAVSSKTYYNGDLKEVELCIPKLSGDEFTGQVQTILHESMHLIDLYLRADPKKARNWFSTTRPKLAADFKDTMPIAKLNPKISKMFNEANKNYEAIRIKVFSEYKKKTAALKESYFSNDASMRKDLQKYEAYKKELDKIKKLKNEALNYECRNAMNGINNLMDIYDAFSGGIFRNKKVVKYGHGEEYYKSRDRRIKETLANYGALSITRPDLIELLREDKPELVAELEETVKEMLKKAGE